ncbi:MAG TPA: acyltransferase, partial [Anaeromyxobacteraceae bacterium]|nr:acyltransferase [Anaeromyxobacteraceae bacterium]
MEHTSPSPTAISPTARIFPTARIVHDGTNLTIGDHTHVDDFVFIYAGLGCRLGRFVHVASFTSVIGGGTLVMEDFSGLSAGCRVVTGTDDFTGPFLHTPGVPRELRNVQVSHVTIGKSVLVGTNVVILPGVTIGEGAAVAAGSIVRRDLAPWGVYGGEPLRRIGERAREGILEKRRLALERLA